MTLEEKETAAADALAALVEAQGRENAALEAVRRTRAILSGLYRPRALLNRQLAREHVLTTEMDEELRRLNGLVAEHREALDANMLDWSNRMIETDTARKTWLDWLAKIDAQEAAFVPPLPTALLIYRSAARRAGILFKKPTPEPVMPTPPEQPQEETQQ